MLYYEMVACQHLTIGALIQTVYPPSKVGPLGNKKVRKMLAVLAEITQISKYLIMPYICSSGTGKHYIVTHYLGT